MKGTAMFTATRTRTLSTLAVLTLSAGLLTACGGSGGNDAYCSELKSDKAYFNSIGTGNDPAKIDKAFEKFHSLAKKSPDAVADDWKVLDDAITTIQKALKDAGVSFADLAKAQGGQLPKGVDPQKLAAIAPKLQALSGPKFDKATKAIEKNAKDACNVTFS
jgi:hypothetical protein